MRVLLRLLLVEHQPQLSPQFLRSQQGVPRSLAVVQCCALRATLASAKLLHFLRQSWGFHLQQHDISERVWRWVKIKGYPLAVLLHCSGEQILCRADASLS
jgi:hypothetical protein